jgi:hypothetical protein
MLDIICISASWNVLLPDKIVPCFWMIYIETVNIEVLIDYSVVEIVRLIVTHAIDKPVSIYRNINGRFFLKDETYLSYESKQSIY